MKTLFILLFIFIAISCNKSTVKLNEFYFQEQNIVNAKNEVDSLLKKDFKSIHWKTLLHSNNKLVSTVFLNDSIASEINFKVIPMLTIKNSSIKNYKNKSDFYSNLEPDEKNMMVLLKYGGRVFAEATFHNIFGKWSLREMRAIPKVTDGFWEQDDNLNECFFVGVLADKKSDESIIIRKYCCRFQHMKCYWLSLNGSEKHEFNDFFLTSLGKVIENYIDNLGREAEKAVDKFESILGEKESKELSSVVRIFERELIKYYGVETEAEAYQIYLNELSKSVEIKIEGFPLNDIVARLGKSSVRNEIWIKPDSCWQKESKLFCRYTYDNTSVNYTYYLKEGEQINSSEYIILNKNGKFFKGLYSAIYDKYVEAYLENIKISGVMSPTLLASSYSQANMDYSNYFVKRFILIEILFKDYMW